MEVVSSAAENNDSSSSVAVSNGTVVNQKKMSNRIQVSNTKKPLFFYVNLAKRYMRQHSEVELSALGMAIATVVTIAEILKNNGLAIEKKIMTSTVDMRDETKGRLVQKAKIEIVLGKTENFDTLMAAAAAASSTVSDAAPTAGATTTVSDVVSAATATVSKVVSAATSTVSEVVSAATATESGVVANDKKHDEKV